MLLLLLLLLLLLILLMLLLLLLCCHCCNNKCYCYCYCYHCCYCFFLLLLLLDKDEDDYYNPGDHLREHCATTAATAATAKIATRSKAATAAFCNFRSHCFIGLDRLKFRSDQFPPVGDFRRYLPAASAGLRSSRRRMVGDQCPLRRQTAVSPQF